DPKAPITNVNGGQGADFISYTVNSPIQIEGGDGFDTLTVVGTEFGDDFVVNEKGVYGAGLFVSYAGIEKVVVDALEGNDHFYVGSTSDSVQIELVGGKGSDTFDVGGSPNGQPVAVVSNDGNGHSGLIDMSTPGAYVPDVSANVRDNDEAGVVITPLASILRVFEEFIDADPLVDPRATMVYASYTVVLTRPPEENVYVKAKPTLPKEADVKAGGKGLALSTSAGAPGDEAGVTLVFDSNNWFLPQTVYVTAPNDTFAEGVSIVNIQHSVRQGANANDGGAYDGINVASLAAEVVDNDSSSVVVAQKPDGSFVTEGGSSTTYQVVLSRAPTGTVHVTLGSDGQ